MSKDDKRFGSEWPLPEAAFSRELIDDMVNRGVITLERGEELLRYTVGPDVGTAVDNYGMVRHILTGHNGDRELCGGPGRCKLCNNRSTRRYV